VGKRAVGVVVAGLAVGALLVARAVRAQEPEPTPVAPLPDPPKPAVAGRALAPASVPTVRRLPVIAYAPEAAASASRLPPEERAARVFLRSVALAATIETEASRMAVVRGNAPAVRSFAIDLLEAHQAAEPALLRLLHAREMAPPLMDIGQRKALQRLAKASGAKFDREYLDLVLPRQARDEVEQYERALQVITDPVLRAWIERQLPLLREQSALGDRLVVAKRTEAVARQRAE
jgi:putative membrane protein